MKEEEKEGTRLRRGPKPLTHEQAQAYGRLGGLKRQENLRRRKSLREALGTLLGAELMFGDEEMRSVLQQAGLKELTNADGISFAILAKACQGDSNALRFVRDLCAEEAPRPAGEKEGRGLALDLKSLSDEELRRMVSSEREE